MWIESLIGLGSTIALGSATWVVKSITRHETDIAVLKEKIDRVDGNVTKLVDNLIDRAERSLDDGKRKS